jgi:hypothetical protein
MFLGSGTSKEWLALEEKEQLEDLTLNGVVFIYILRN